MRFNLFANYNYYLQKSKKLCIDKKYNKLKIGTY